MRQQATFEPTPPAIKRSRLVLEQVLARIYDGRLPPGSRLPGERGIATEMRVSRTAVREALSALQLAGIIESRSGDGTYVSEALPDIGTKSPSQVLGQRVAASLDVVETVEAREVLDVGVVRLLSRSGMRIDTRVMHETLAKMRHAIDANEIVAYLELTLDLHVSIAEATGNQILVETVRSLAALVHDRLWVIEKQYTPERGAFSYSVHKAIVEALEQGDFYRAIEEVERHYREYPSLH